jgi:hypothetical protein
LLSIILVLDDVDAPLLFTEELLVEELLTASLADERLAVALEALPTLARDDLPERLAELVL